MSKKLSSIPTSSRPRTSHHISVSTRSLVVLGAIKLTSVPVAIGAGNARRSNLPLGVRGKAPIMINADGIM